MEPDSAAETEARRKLLHKKLRYQRAILDAELETQRDAWKRVGTLFHIKSDLKLYYGVVTALNSHGKPRPLAFRDVLQYALADDSLLGGFAAKLTVTKLESDVIYFETARILERQTGFWPQSLQLVAGLSCARHDVSTLLSAYEKATETIASNHKVDKLKLARECLAAEGFNLRKRKRSEVEAGQQPEETPAGSGSSSDHDTGAGQDDRYGDDLAALDQAAFPPEDEPLQLPACLKSAVQDGVADLDAKFQELQSQLTESQAECANLRKQHAEVSSAYGSLTQQYINFAVKVTCQIYGSDTKENCADVESAVSAATDAVSWINEVYDILMNGVRDTVVLLQGTPSSNETDHPAAVAYLKAAAQSVVQAREDARAAAAALATYMQQTEAVLEGQPGSSSSSILTVESATSHGSKVQAAAQSVVQAREDARAAAGMLATSMQQATAKLNGQPGSSSNNSSSMLTTQSAAEQVQGLEAAVDASTSYIRLLEQDNSRLEKETAMRQPSGSYAVVKSLIKAAATTLGSSQQPAAAAAAGAAGVTTLSTDQTSEEASNDVQPPGQALEQVAAAHLIVDQIPDPLYPGVCTDLWPKVPAAEDQLEALVPHIMGAIKCSMYHQQRLQLDPMVGTVAAMVGRDLSAAAAECGKHLLEQQGEAKQELLRILGSQPFSRVNLETAALRSKRQGLVTTAQVSRLWQAHVQQHMRLSQLQHVQQAAAAEGAGLEASSE